MLEIKDLAGLSQPITKLIDVFVNGCKWIAEPYQIKRIAMQPHMLHQFNPKRTLNKD